MILTNCAACAAPLAHDAPRCVRCKTRYCNATCQHDHWRRGHKQICKKIHRGGNAEQYHADKKYKEAVAAAAEACADDTIAGDPGSTLDDIREAMTMLEDLTRITRRVFGSAHPLVALCEDSLRIVRKKLGASETPSASAQSTK